MFEPRREELEEEIVTVHYSGEITPEREFVKKAEKHPLELFFEKLDDYLDKG